MAMPVYPGDRADAADRSRKYRAAITAIAGALDLVRNDADDDTLWNMAASFVDFAAGLRSQHERICDHAHFTGTLDISADIERWSQYVERRRHPITIEEIDALLSRDWTKP